MSGEIDTPGVLFSCPVCGAASASHFDATEGYCGRCHDWTTQSNLDARDQR